MCAAGSAVAQAAHTVAPQPKFLLHCVGQNDAGQRVEHSIVMNSLPESTTLTGNFYATLDEDLYKLLHLGAVYSLEGPVWAAGWKFHDDTPPIKISIDRLSGNYTLVYDPKGMLQGQSETGVCEKGSPKF